MSKQKATTISSLANIEACWLYRDRQYNYFDAGNPVTLLPTVDSSYKPILDELCIPYRENQFGDYEFWDPDCYEETVITLPLFIKVPEGFQLVEKNHTGVLITFETTEAAFALFENKIEPLKDEKEENARQSAIISKLQYFLNGQVACGINWKAFSHLDGIYFKEKLEFKNDDTHIIVLPVHTLMSEERQLELKSFYIDWEMADPDIVDFRIRTDYIATFDMTKLSVGAAVDLFVPEGTEGLFVGRGGWQVKEWCEELGGLRKINVKAAK